MDNQFPEPTVSHLSISEFAERPANPSGAPAAFERPAPDLPERSSGAGLGTAPKPKAIPAQGA